VNIVKTHYEIIGVEPTATAEEIKRKFRQEIARYHPDKVQHLGMEFQELASLRAAELTAAYRVLMDEGQRAEYDSQIAEGTVAHAAPAPAAAPESSVPHTVAFEPPAAEERPSASRFQKEHATRDDFVRRAAMARFRSAVEAELEGCQPLPPIRGFDAGYVHRPRRGLFKKSDAALRVLGRFVARVDSATLQETWLQAVKEPGDGPSVIFLMGNSLAPARELAAAIAEQRRKSRTATAVTVIPVDVRDWQALIPTDAPALVKPLLQRLGARDR